MPDVNKVENNEEEVQEEKGANIFGEGEDTKPEVKKEEKAEDKKFEAIPDDHPTIVKLTAEIDKVKSEYGGNLSGQRQVIDRLQKEIDDLKAGNKPKEEDADVLYKDIKWSKDLTEEQRDAMTETEIKQMDELAEIKTKQNEMYSSSQKGAKEQESKKADDLQSLVKNTALELSKDEDGKENTELANQIIESAKQFNLVGLDEKTIKERVITAHKLLPNYAPPKEKITKKGNTVKDTTKTEDPFGVDAIIDEVSGGSDGNYDL